MLLCRDVLLRLIFAFNNLLFSFRNDSAVRQTATNKSYSQCWPSDWLPTDVEGLRVIGVDYSTTLSEWLPSCPLKQKRYNFHVLSKPSLKIVFLAIVLLRVARIN